MKRLARLVGGCLVVCVLACAVAAADSPLKSPHYEIDESTLGGSGLTQSSSSSYQLGDNVGDTAIGSSSSTNFQLNSGYNTTSDPALAFAVDTSNANFGTFNPTGTATATTTFEVSNYTSYGYVVQILGNPPSSGGHTISAMATTGPSQAGTEQFGINLVANTAPTSFGANPNQGQFGDGVAATNYNTPNQFRYVSGETIALAPKSSGVTIYTISYIVNVSSLTPGGQYSGHQTLVCTGTY